MHILNDDKGAHDIANLSKVHLSVEVFMQHPPSQLEFFVGPINEEVMDVVNLQEIVNLDEDDHLSKLYEELVTKVQKIEVNMKDNSVNYDETLLEFDLTHTYKTDL